MMSVQQTTGIRELSAHELDQVTGGMSFDTFQSIWMVSVGMAAAVTVGAALGRLWDWLTD